MNMVFNKMKEKTLLHIISGIQYGSLELTLPDGSTHHFTGKHKVPSGRYGVSAACRWHQADDCGMANGVLRPIWTGLSPLTGWQSLIESLTVLHNDYVEQQMQMNMLGTITQKLNHWRNANSREQVQPAILPIITISGMNFIKAG